MSKNRKMYYLWAIVFVICMIGAAGTLIKASCMHIQSGVWGFSYELAKSYLNAATLTPVGRILFAAIRVLQAHIRITLGTQEINFLAVGLGAFILGLFSWWQMDKFYILKCREENDEKERHMFDRVVG